MFTVLLVFSQLAWIEIGRTYFLRPFRAEYSRGLMYFVDFARHIVASSPATTWNEGSRMLELANGLAIYGQQPRAAQVAVSPDMTRYLKEMSGEDVELFEVGDHKSRIWIRFPVAGHSYWLSVFRGHDVFTPSIPMLAWLVIAIASSLAGAYLLVGYLNHRLLAVVAGVRAVGRGEDPGRIRENGPDEIRMLTRGFNQMYAGLAKMDSDRRLMIAGISHDLRTPLARLRVGLELNSDTIKPAHLRGMEDDIDQIDCILTQFLDFARDEQQEPWELYCIEDIVTDVCERYRLAGNAIRTNLAKLPPVLIRPHAIRRLITNLVANAVEYGKDGIEVETARDGNCMVLTVCDRGPGVRTADPKELLRPFVRGDESRSRTGSGLGLAIAQRIALSHRGTLELVNRDGGGLAAVARLLVYA